jgi:transcriptional regulator with XRE-family HTH domain
MSRTIDFLKQHESKTPSKFQENAEWRRENREWLKWSREVALSLVDYMETNEINRNGLAERLGVTPQYVSRMLSGKVNFSFKSIAEIESKLSIKLLNIMEPA